MELGVATFSNASCGFLPLSQEGRGACAVSQFYAAECHSRRGKTWNAMFRGDKTNINHQYLRFSVGFLKLEDLHPVQRLTELLDGLLHLAPT